MNESGHTYEWVVSHTYEWVVSQTWVSHVAHMNESLHTYKWVMSHKWMSQVNHMNESCYTGEWVMSLIWMSHVTHGNESWHSFEWFMSHTWMSHVTYMNESYHTHERRHRCGAAPQNSHATTKLGSMALLNPLMQIRSCETWLIHQCDVTHSLVWHDSCISVTWLIHTLHDVFICELTHSYVI